MLLALGGDANADFVEGFDGGILPLTNKLGIQFGLGPSGPTSLESLCGLSNLRLELFKVSKTDAKRFSDLHRLLNVEGAAVLEVCQLVLGKFLFVSN